MKWTNLGKPYGIFVGVLNKNNDQNNNGAEVSSEMGRQESEANASDRAVLPSEMDEGTSTEIS